MLTEAGCEKIFIDKRSGKNIERPELIKMLEILRKDDIVVITELSRLGRSLVDIVNLTAKFNQSGVHLQVVSSQRPIDTTTPEGKFFLYSMANLAEFQREITVQNTKEGLEAARARGRKGGRPPVDAAKINTAMKMYKSKQYSIKEICQTVGISQSTLYKAINKKGVTQ
jgi:DNA invertase Pin-like site-specific DNA recombinase